MRRRDRDPPLLLLRRLVDLIERYILRPSSALTLRDRLVNCLPMINMPIVHIHMRSPLKLLSTFILLRWSSWTAAAGPSGRGPAEWLLGHRRRHAFIMGKLHGIRARPCVLDRSWWHSRTFPLRAPGLPKFAIRFGLPVQDLSSPGGEVSGHLPDVRFGTTTSTA